MGEPNTEGGPCPRLSPDRDPMRCGPRVPFPFHRGPARAQAHRPEEGSHQGLSPACPPRYVLILSRIMQILCLPQPFPGVPTLEFCSSPFSLSHHAFLSPSQTHTDDAHVQPGPGGGAITFRLYLLAPGLPRPSPPLPDQPWLLSGAAHPTKGTTVFRPLPMQRGELGLGFPTWARAGRRSH